MTRGHPENLAPRRRRYPGRRARAVRPRPPESARSCVLRLDRHLRPLQTPGQRLTESLQIAKHNVRRKFRVSPQLDADRDPESLATGESKDGTCSRQGTCRTGQVLNFPPGDRPEAVSRLSCSRPATGRSQGSGRSRSTISQGRHGRVAKLDPLDSLPGQLGGLSFLACPGSSGPASRPARLVSSSRRLVTTTRNARQPEIPRMRRQDLVLQGHSQKHRAAQEPREAVEQERRADAGQDPGQ